MSKPEELIKERRNVHGSWQEQSAVASQLKNVLRTSSNWHGLTAAQSEALDMIAVKMSRIVIGDPTYADHWDDIMGYALLGKQGDH